VRELEARDVEQFGNLLDRGTRGPLHVDTFECGAHLHLEEHAQQVRAMRADLGEVTHRRFEIELGLLPRVKCAMAAWICAPLSRSST
jgi:hypothetical protein